MTQIEEVAADIGEPDCKLEKPFNLTIQENSITLSPWLLGLTNQDFVMISSEKILTLADPTETILKKYEDLIKE